MAYGSWLETNVKFSSTFRSSHLALLASAITQGGHVGHWHAPSGSGSRMPSVSSGHPLPASDTGGALQRPQVKGNIWQSPRSLSLGSLKDTEADTVSAGLCPPCAHVFQSASFQPQVPATAWGASRATKATRAYIPGRMKWQARSFHPDWLQVAGKHPALDPKFLWDQATQYSKRSEPFS